MSIPQAVIDAPEHDILNQHVAPVGAAGAPTGEVPVQATRKLLQGPAPVDRRNPVAHLHRQ